MDKVYIVFAGEQYGSEQLVSVHKSLDGAKAAAAVLAAEDEDGIVYASSRDGRLWEAPSGHFIAVRAEGLEA